jgi:capsular polysaccharide biosynthesis protein
MIVKAGEYKALNKIELIDDPIKPVVPSSPDIVNNTVLGFLFGAAACCALIILKELFDKKIKNLEIREIPFEKTTSRKIKRHLVK